MAVTIMAGGPKTPIAGRTVEVSWRLKSPAGREINVITSSEERRVI
jgi:hypothetical protein